MHIPTRESKSKRDGANGANFGKMVVCFHRKIHVREVRCRDKGMEAHRGATWSRDHRYQAIIMTPVLLSGMPP